MEKKAGSGTAALFTVGFGAAFIFFSGKINHQVVDSGYYEPSREEIEEYIQRKGVGECGVDAVVWRSLIEQESGYKNNSIRFEPHIVPRAKKLSSDPRDIPMIASSHGLLQILGTNAVAAGYKWQDLYKLDVAFDVGCKLLKDCYSRAKGIGKQKLSSMFACWNGSTSYGANVAGKVEKSMFESMQIAKKKSFNNPHNEQLDTKGMDNLLARLW